MKLNLSNAKKVAKTYGFGASAAWWSPSVKDEKTQNELAELLYGDSGLELNIYRYNVGGGFEEGNVRVDNPWRVIESFMNEDGSFDWNRDKHAVSMMKKCLDKGNIDTLIFFVNSPHYSHTITRQASGGLTEHFSNLRKDCYDAFAKYIVDIAEHFIEEGYPVKYISPINEPQWKWGGSYVWQEGCHYEPEEVRDCFLAVAKELERRNSSLLLYGPESGNISELTKKYYKLLSAEPIIMKYLDTFAYHSYGSDKLGLNKIAFGKWAKRNVKTPRFDMSEWCELPCKHPIDSIEGTIIMARIIGEDFAMTGSNSWTAWVAVNQYGKLRDGKSYSDGLLTAEDDFSKYEISMRYYAVAHYSKYIPSGSISLSSYISSSRGMSAYAFKRPDKSYVIVVSNHSKANRTIEPDIAFSEAEVITTTADVRLESEITTDKKIHIKPMSVTTIILK